MTKHKLITLLVLLSSTIDVLFANDSYSHDYIITNQGDTISGQVTFSILLETPTTIKFTKTGEQKAVKYTPDVIRKFIHQGDLYISKNIPLPDSLEGSRKTVRKFLIVGVEGKVSLYSYIHSGGEKKFYIEKDNQLYPLDYRNNVGYNQEGTRYVTEDNSFRRQLRYLLQDQSSLFDQIEHADYDDKSLISVIKRYDNQGGRSPVYSSRREQDTTVVKFGITIGSSIGKLFFTDGNYKYNYLWESDFTSKIAPDIGLNIEYFFLMFRKRFSLYQELLYTPYEYEYAYISNTLKHTYYKTTFDISYLNFTNILRYNFIRDRRIQYYLGAGGVLGLALKKKNSVFVKYLDTNNSEVLYSESGSALAGFSVFRGALNLAAGARYKKFALEYRFGYGTGLTITSSSYQSSMTTHMASLQYSF